MQSIKNLGFNTLLVVIGLPVSFIVMFLILMQLNPFK